MRFHSAAALIPDIARIIAPRIRRTVSETAAAVVRVPSPSGAMDHWDPQLTPYMVEPMDTLESYKYKAVVFVGPAQSGKTNGLIDCWLAHVATASPSKMLIVQSTQANARDYERDNYRPLKRHSPEVAAAILPGGHSDNTYDKLLRTGQAILFRYPSENVLQGKAIPRIALTDLDRMPENIGGQGHPFDLSLKRARTFHYRGTVLGESSPGNEQSDPQWHPATPHQAPHARGICSFYNLGDRRRLYWQCPHCGEYFMSPPGPDHFIYDIDRDLLGAERPETPRNVGIACPNCLTRSKGDLEDAFIAFEHRRTMLANAKWVPDGCRIDRDGRIEGAPPQTDIASYWLHGVHAAFSDWHSLVLGYLQAKAICEATGSEESLRTVIMQDFGTPYVSQARVKVRRPTELEQRKERHWRRGQSPEGVRWLTALVDTQGTYWSVMIVGRGVAGERWVIDRFEIRKSLRINAAGEEEPVDPAAYLEDWELLTERVVCGTWPLAAHPGKRLAVRLTLVDSGGKAKKGNPEIQVTGRAYDWWRQLRRQGLAHRVAITKGAYSRPGSRTQTIRESYPDASAAPTATPAPAATCPCTSWTSMRSRTPSMATSSARSRARASCTSPTTCQGPSSTSSPPRSAPTPAGSRRPTPAAATKPGTSSPWTSPPTTCPRTPAASSACAIPDPASPSPGPASTGSARRPGPGSRRPTARSTATSRPPSAPRRRKPPPAAPRPSG